jgi:hypothetical protein
MPVYGLAGDSVFASTKPITIMIIPRTLKNIFLQFKG